MLRNAIAGALAFGVAGFVAGYAWTALEFPFFLGLAWIVGWAVVVFPYYGARKAAWAALLGGVTFTVAFTVALFLAITDGSPLPIAGWLGTALAASLAGALTGKLLDGRRGALPMALWAGAGMLVGTMITSVMRQFAPGSVDIEGVTQFLWFATAQGVVGAVTGAALGAGVAWLAAHRHTAGTEVGTPTRPTPTT